MRTQQGLVRLPEELVRRLKRQVLAPARSAFVQRLIEEALPAEDGNDDPFYQVACAVERDERLADEMADWDATIDDGLEATKAHAREPAFIGSATRAARRSLAGQSGPGPRRRDPQDAPGCGGDGGRVESGAANSRGRTTLNWSYAAPACRRSNAVGGKRQRCSLRSGAGRG